MFHKQKNLKNGNQQENERVQITVPHDFFWVGDKRYE